MVTARLRSRCRPRIMGTFAFAARNISRRPLGHRRLRGHHSCPVRPPPRSPECVGVHCDSERRHSYRGPHFPIRRRRFRSDGGPDATIATTDSVPLPHVRRPSCTQRITGSDRRRDCRGKRVGARPRPPSRRGRDLGSHAGVHRRRSHAGQMAHSREVLPFADVPPDSPGLWTANPRTN